MIGPRLPSSAQWNLDLERARDHERDALVSIASTVELLLEKPESLAYWLDRLRELVAQRDVARAHRQAMAQRPNELGRSVRTTPFATCVLCKREPVDAEGGFDTCGDCAVRA